MHEVMQNMLRLRETPKNQNEGEKSNEDDSQNISPSTSPLSFPPAPFLSVSNRPHNHSG